MNTDYHRGVKMKNGSRSEVDLISAIETILTNTDNIRKDSVIIGINATVNEESLFEIGQRFCGMWHKITYYPNLDPIPALRFEGRRIN